MYDVRGVDSDTPSVQTRHEYDGDISPEDLFEMFFGGGLHQRRRGGAYGKKTFLFFNIYTYTITKKRSNFLFSYYQRGKWISNIYLFIWRTT
jgi:hypothetical protein